MHCESIHEQCVQMKEASKAAKYTTGVGVSRYASSYTIAMRPALKTIVQSDVLLPRRCLRRVSSSDTVRNTDVEEGMSCSASPSAGWCSPS